MPKFLSDGHFVGSSTDLAIDGNITGTGNLTLTHGSTPFLQVIDSTNDVDLKIKAANSYGYIELDNDNDANSSRLIIKVDGGSVHEYLATGQIAHVDGTYTIRRTNASNQVSLDLSTRKDHTGSGNFTSGDDVGRLNFKARDSVVTSDLTVASIIAEADNTFTSSDQKARMKFQLRTGSSNANVLFLDSDKSASFYGNILINSNTAITSGRNFYGTIFYDADNTSYYLDPASSTISLDVNGRITRGSKTFSGTNGVHADARLGIVNNGSLTSIVNASTYNDANYPDYGLVFIQGPSTSSYNVWSISPDGPAKGSDLNFIYQAQATNIHTQTPMLKLHGSTGNATFSGTVTWSGGGSANSNTAYTYSQVGHLPLAGGTMTGAIDFGNVTGRAITITGDSNLDNADASIYLGNATSSYGWDIKYLGTGTGNDNKLQFISTNAGSPVTALSFTQDGNATFSGQLLLPSTTSDPGSSPAISFDSGAGGIFYDSDDDQLWLRADGGKRAYVSNAGIISQANVYSGSSSAFRNYGGVWKGTTGIANNGFYFLNTANNNTTRAMDLSHDGNVVFNGYVRGTIFADKDATSFYVNPGAGANSNAAVLRGQIKIGTHANANNTYSDGGKTQIATHNSKSKYSANSQYNGVTVLANDARKDNTAMATTALVLGNTASNSSTKSLLRLNRTDGRYNSDSWSSGQGSFNVRFDIRGDGKIYAYGNIYTGSYSYFGAAYYSQSNTNYYLDPDGTSELNAVNLSGVVNIANNLSLTGDSRILNLAGGSTTNSQSRVIIGEQGTYGVSFRWNSGSDLEFDGFWNSSVTGSRNRDLGSVDVNNRRWNFENTVEVGGSVTAGSFVKSGGTSSQFLMADGSVSTGGGTATTINNNADNRVITGSGTADTLEAESGLTFDGNILEITGSGTTTKRMKVSPGTDYGRAHIGRAALGKLGFDDHAGFAHEDHNTQTNYALLQSSTANTYVNAASGKAGYLRINNSTIGYWNANGLHAFKYFDSSDTNYYLDPAATSTSLTVAGKVGIGELTPLSKLEVAGSIKATNRDSAHTSEAGLTMSYDTTNSIGLIETWTSKPLLTRTYNYQAFDISGTEMMRINSTGVGIGVTDPDAKLEVKGPTSDDQSYNLRLRSADDQELMYVRNDGIVKISHNYLYVDNSAGFYSNGAIRARAGVTDDGGTLGLGGNGQVDNLVLTSNTSATFAGDITIGGTFHPLSLLSKSYDTSNTSSSVSAGSSLDDEYELLTFGENASPLYLNIKTVAHNSASFVITRGYHGSNTASIQCTGSTYTANSGYAALRGIRVIKSGTAYKVIVRLFRSSSHVAFGLFARAWGGTATEDIVFNTTLTDTFTETTALGGINDLSQSGSFSAAYSRDALWVDGARAAFGDTKDLQIYHDGSNSRIETTGTSAGDLRIFSQGSGHDLYLEATDDIFIRPQGGENGIKVFGNGGVELYHNNNKKLETTSSGADVTGDLTVSGGDITLGGTGRIQGIDTVSAGTDAVNKNYVDNNFASADTTYEFNFSTQLTANTWTDTGIDGTDMATGTYIMRVEVSDHNLGGQHYDEAYSATISWFEGSTNSTMHDEIVIHRAGHAPNNGDIQFRTLRASNSDTHDLMLQVKHNQTYSAAPDQSSGKKFKFKFRKMI